MPEKTITKTSGVRYDNIDIMKVIAVICVILSHNFHINNNFIEDNTITKYICYMFYYIIGIGVPIFVTVNGYLLIGKEFNWKKHIKKTIKIGILILIWSTIDVIVIKMINNETISIKNIIKNVILANINNPYNGILWFLQNLLALYLIFPVVKCIYDRDKKIYKYLFILVITFSVGINLIELILNMIGNVINKDIVYYFKTFIRNYNPIANATFLMFFMLGGALFEKKEEIKGKKAKLIGITIGIIGLVLAIIYGIIISKLQNKVYEASNNYSTIFMVCIIIGTYTITQNYKSHGHWYNKLIQSIAKNSLGIYLVHILFTKVMTKYVPRDNLELTVVNVVGILVASYITTIVIRKIPILKKVLEI